MKHKPPKRAVRWGLFDVDGHLVLVYDSKKINPVFPKEFWCRVDVVPRKKRSK